MSDEDEGDRFEYPPGWYCTGADVLALVLAVIVLLVVVKLSS